MARRNQTLELVLSGNSRGAENAIDRVDNRTGRFNKTLGRAAKAAGLFVAALGIAADCRRRACRQSVCRAW